MGAIAEGFAAYLQPLIDETDGSYEQLEKALVIGQLCFNTALLPDDKREAMIAKMQTSFGMADDEFADFRRSIVDPMIARHEEMFPRMHGRDAVTPSPSGGGLGWGQRCPSPQSPPTTPAKRYAGTDRYAPCPCKSGKKYKFCCGAPSAR